MCPGAAVRLLTVQRKSAVLLHVKSGRVELLQTLESDPVALAFDVARGWYYWADDRGSIYRSSGQHATTRYAGELSWKVALLFKRLLWWKLFTKVLMTITR